MPLKLVHLESDDEFDALVRCEFAAYESPPNKLKELFFPPQDSRESTIQAAVGRQTAWHRGDPTSVWLKVVDTDNDDRLLGAACWHVYDTDPYAVESDEECDWFPKGEERDIGNALMGQFLTPRMTYMRKPHVFLDICFTHPDARRRGVGKLLMDWGVQQADERGYEAFVDATDLGRELYRTYGFIDGEKRQLDMSQFKDTQRKKELEELFTPFEWWPMHRSVGGKYEPGKGMLPWEKQ